MWSLFTNEPAEFAEHHLGYTGRALKTTLRRAGWDARVGLAPPLDKEDIRRCEIAVALWKLLTRPSDDVLVGIGHQALWNGWLKDLESLTALGGSHELKQAAHIIQRKVVHKLVGFGSIRHFITSASDAVIPPCRGEAPTLILSGLDRAATETVTACAARFQPPSLFVTSIYPRLEHGFPG